MPAFLTALSGVATVFSISAMQKTNFTGTKFIVILHSIDYVREHEETEKCMTLNTGQPDAGRLSSKAVQCAVFLPVVSSISFLLISILRLILRLAYRRARRT
jgi:hypothetical protein